MRVEGTSMPGFIPADEQRDYAFQKLPRGHALQLVHILRTEYRAERSVSRLVYVMNYLKKVRHVERSSSPA